jgi:hypothetical protein
MMDTTLETMTSTPLSTCEIMELNGVFLLKRPMINPMRIDFANGAFYRGETNADGMCHGWGEILYTNDTVIAGEWVDGVLGGKGVYMSKEMTYKGDFRNNAFHGKGRQTYHADGDVYMGGFANGERDGHGKVSWPNGSYYTGCWKDGLMNGLGSLCAHGKIHSGYWTNGCQHKGGLVSEYTVA